MVRDLKEETETVIKEHTLGVGVGGRSNGLERVPNAVIESLNSELRILKKSRKILKGSK